ncbi:transposase [Microcoleus vaginatus FACHB-2002]
MQLTERHIIKSTEHRFAQIDELAFKSKNLYNAAHYVIRQNFIYGWGYVNYNEMNRFMKFHEAYKALPAKVSQQILMILDKNWKSFFEAVKAYKVDDSKFTVAQNCQSTKIRSKDETFWSTRFKQLVANCLIKELLNFRVRIFQLKPR